MPENHNFQKKALAAAVTAACLSTSYALQAQDESTSLLEEVIVTA